MESYCVKCRKKVESINTIESRTSKGIKILKGNCPICKNKTCRIIGK